MLTNILLILIFVVMCGILAILVMIMKSLTVKGGNSVPATENKSIQGGTDLTRSSEAKAESQSSRLQSAKKPVTAKVICPGCYKAVSEHSQNCPLCGYSMR